MTPILIHVCGHRWIKENPVKRWKEYDTYLTHVCGHRWIKENPVKRWKEYDTYLTHVCRLSRSIDSLKRIYKKTGVFSKYCGFHHSVD